MSDSQKSDLISTWERRKEDAGKENLEIMKKLRRKRGRRLDEAADAAHAGVFDEIDCLDCANCCSSIPPIVNKTDVNRISKKLSMKPAEFEETYLTVDEDGDTVMNQSPCPFLLEDHTCFIYEVRPKACRQFPHTDEMTFSKNSKLHAMNATVCPGVFHIIRKLYAAVE